MPMTLWSVEKMYLRRKPSSWCTACSCACSTAPLPLAPMAGSNVLTDHLIQPNAALPKGPTKGRLPVRPDSNFLLCRLGDTFRLLLAGCSRGRFLCSVAGDAVVKLFALETFEI